MLFFNEMPIYIVSSKGILVPELLLKTNMIRNNPPGLVRGSITMIDNKLEYGALSIG